LQTIQQTQKKDEQHKKAGWEFTKVGIRLYIHGSCVVCFSFFLATCARWSWILSFRVHVKPLYRIVSYRIVFTDRLNTVLH